MGAAWSDGPAEPAETPGTDAATAAEGALSEPLLGSPEAPGAPGAPEDPAPLAREPGEAQREPCDWPLPKGLAAAASGGAEDAASAHGGCLARCRSACRVLGNLLIAGGALLAVAGALHGCWAPLFLWAKQHALSLAGAAVALLGVLLRCVTHSPRHAVRTEVPSWDTLAWADEGGRQPQRFSFTIWNDALRFQADAKSLNELLAGRADGLTGKKLLHSEPELRKLVRKAERSEAGRRSKRSAAAHKALVARCKASLEEGVSARRVQQSIEPRCFVLDFSDDGGLDASTPQRSMSGKVKQLRNAVSFLLTVCSPYDEVVLRITSPGGLVSDYGLASSHLLRLRRAGVRLVACVDTVAASGGYMMACAADCIIAAPFALVGSIGVVAGLPNFHRVLQRLGVDYLLFTAGRFKRTVGVFSQNDREGIAKFQEEINTVHSAFTAHVEEGRGTRIEGGAGAAATGEAFLASEALARGLVDRLCTSEEYLRQRAAEGFLIIELRPASHRRGCLQELWEPFVSRAVGAASALAGRFTATVEAMGNSSEISAIPTAPSLATAAAERQLPLVAARM